MRKNILDILAAVAFFSFMGIYVCSHLTYKPYNKGKIIRCDTFMQTLESQWIEANIPTNRTIGINHGIYWWTPDIIYESAHHPERMKHPYKVFTLYYSIPETKRLHPDYILLSGRERYYDTTFHSEGEPYLKWLDSGAMYDLAVTFEPDIHFYNFHWNRDEYYGQTSDDTWVTSLAIMRRKELKNDPILISLAEGIYDHKN